MAAQVVLFTLLVHTFCTRQSQTRVTSPCSDSEFSEGFRIHSIEWKSNYRNSYLYLDMFLALFLGHIVKAYQKFYNGRPTRTVLSKLIDRPADI